MYKRIDVTRCIEYYRVVYIRVGISQSNLSHMLAKPADPKKPDFVWVLTWQKKPDFVKQPIWLPKKLRFSIFFGVSLRFCHRKFGDFRRAPLSVRGLRGSAAETVPRKFQIIRMIRPIWDIIPTLLISV